MFKRLSVQETIVIIIASCVVAAFAAFLSLRLTIAPNYSDFIVGSLAWYAGTKFQDLLAPLIFVVALLLTLWILTKIVFQFNEKTNHQDKAELGGQILWWLLPLAVTMGGIIMGGVLGLPTESTLFYIFFIAALAVGVILGCGLWRGKKLDAPIVGLAIMGALLSALTPMDVALVLGRAPVGLIGDIDISKYVSATYYVGAICIFTVMAQAFFWPDQLRFWMPRLLLLGQIGLTLWFLTLYPARLVTTGGGGSKYATTGGLKVLLLGVLLWGVADVLRRYKKYRMADSKTWEILLSPIAIFGVIVAFNYSLTISPQISPDDYHFGEGLLGWWSYLHGKIPYIDYMPAHGLVDDWAGFLSNIFYDGTAASISEANRLGSALLALAAYLTIYRLSSSVGLAFISIFFLSRLLLAYGGQFQWLFLVPFLGIWLSRSLSDIPARWLAIWLLTAPVVILAVPPQGLLLVAAFSVIGLWHVWQIWGRHKQQRLGDIGVSLGLLLLAAFLTPLLSMLQGAIRYVFENGAVNQVAYGVPWALGWSANNKLSQVIFEVVRMSWMAIPAISLILIISNIKNRSRWESLVPSVVVFLFAIFLIPYSMGRIDPGALSRPGLAAIFGWTILVPLAAWPLVRTFNRSVFILGVALAGAMLNYGSLYSLSFSSLITAVSAKVAAGPLQDGKSVGLPNIGKAVVQEDHWGRITRLNGLLNEKLLLDETYLDLTSRNAQYFYLNRLPPMAVSAPYNMVSLPQQQRAVSDLTHKLPRLALLEADNIIHDGGGLALRNHLLYRFVLDNYIPVWNNGFIVGYRKQDSLVNETNTVKIPVKNLNDINWDRGIHRREAAIVFSDPTPLLGLTIGAQVLLGNGEYRHITGISIQDRVISLDGTVMDPSKVGAPNIVKATIDPKLEHEFKLVLLDKAFSIPDLAKIPVAWGKSESSLIKKMDLVKKIDPGFLTIHDFALNNGGYKVMGNDPSISFDISSFGISGRDAGLLKFNFSCLNRSTEPRIQVFWWGDDQMAASESTSMKFSADDGVLIIPLDAYPRWLTLGKIGGIRIDLDNSVACGAVTVNNVALYQRK